MTTQHQVPTFSIIIPVYNTEKYLRQCIDSILTQDFNDYELWLIDDGSKDSSIEIIKEYAQKDDRIKTAFIKGTGPAMPRNYGLKRAIGKYVMFVDSDDYLTPGALTVFAKTIEEFPDVQFVKAGQFVLNNNMHEDVSVFKQWRTAYDKKQVSGSVLMTEVLKTDFTPTNSLFCRSLLKEHNIYFHENLTFLEDIPFIMEICSIANKCVTILNETYVYRLFSETSLSKSKRTLGKMMSLAMVSYHEKTLSERFTGRSKEWALTRSVEHSILALFNACTELSRSESLEVLSYVMSIYNKMPRLGRSKAHKLYIFVYNLNPTMAHFALRILRPLIRK